MGTAPSPLPGRFSRRAARGRGGPMGSVRRRGGSAARCCGAPWHDGSCSSTCPAAGQEHGAPPGERRAQIAEGRELGGREQPRGAGSGGRRGAPEQRRGPDFRGLHVPEASARVAGPYRARERSGAGRGAAAAPPRRAGAERGRPPWRGPPRRGGRRAAGSTGWSPATRCRGWRCATGSRWSRSCVPTASTPRTPSSSSPPSSSRHRRGRGGSAARRRRWGHRRAPGTPPPRPPRPATTSRPPTSCGSSTPRSAAPRPRRRSGSAPPAPAQPRPKAPGPRRPAPPAAPASAPGPSPGRRGRPRSATPRTRSSRCDGGAGGQRRLGCRPTATGTAGTGRGEPGGGGPLPPPAGVPSRSGETQAQAREPALVRGRWEALGQDLPAGLFPPVVFICMGLPSWVVFFAVGGGGWEPPSLPVSVPGPRRGWGRSPPFPYPENL